MTLTPTQIDIAVLAVGLTLVACAVLVTVLTRAQLSTATLSERSWDIAAHARRQAVPVLAQIDALNHIWTDEDVLQPSQVGRSEGASRARKTFREELGFDDVSEGVVLVAGGLRHLTSAYVLIRQLRASGCALPVEVWHKHGEIPGAAVKELKKWGALALNLEYHLPFVIKTRHCLRAIAMFLSCFERFLYLDADNNVLRDPTFLLSHPDFTSTGALFWPDVLRAPSPPTAPCFALFPVARSSTDRAFHQDAGQMVIDKLRCWKALWHVFRISENNLLDLFPAPQDVFHITWLASRTPFHMLPHRPGIVRQVGRHPGVGTGQLAPDGETLLFLHQTRQEWCRRKQPTPIWAALDRSPTAAVDPESFRFKGRDLTSQDLDPAVEMSSLDVLEEFRSFSWHHLL